MESNEDEKSGASSRQLPVPGDDESSAVTDEFWSFRENVYAAGGHEPSGKSGVALQGQSKPSPLIAPNPSVSSSDQKIREQITATEHLEEVAPIDKPPSPPQNYSPSISVEAVKKGFTNHLLGNLFSLDKKGSSNSLGSDKGSKRDIGDDVYGENVAANRSRKAGTDQTDAVEAGKRGSPGSSAYGILRQASNLSSFVVRRGSNTSQLSEAQRRELSKTKTRVNVTEEVISNAKTVFSKNRFAKWTRAELIELLISEGIELRGEREYAFTALRKICDQHFEGQPMPEKPTPWTPEELLRMEKAVRFVQNKWIDYQFELRNSHNAWDLDIDDDDEAGGVEENWDELEHFDEGDFNDDDDERNLATALANSLLDENRTRTGSVGIGVDSSKVLDIEQGGVGGAGSVGKSSPDLSLEKSASKQKQRKAANHVRSEMELDMLARTFSAIDVETAKKGLQVLDIPWQPPNWEKASIFEKYVKPRQGGKGGAEYDLIETTTGRHCFLYGCGEQCDLFNEGQISQFSLYGPGITNFYKFIKWLFWSFAILSAISFPPLLLNIYGPNVRNMGLANIARTTVGNLANSVVNGTVSVHFPGCNNYGYSDAVDCDFDREMLAKFYSWLEIGTMFFLCISYVWLRLFEKWETKAIDRNVINASMFTVAVKNLPDQCTENELKQHFMQIIPKKYNTSINAVQFAYNCEAEVTLYKRRGKLLKEKARLVNEHRYEVTKLRKEKGHDEAQDGVFKAREDFARKCNAIEHKVRVLNEQLDKIVAEHPVQKPLLAFITFESALGALSAVNLYNLSLIERLYMDEHKLFKGKKLQVSVAPEPSIIIWENLSYGFWSRLARRCVSVIFALLLIAIAVTVTFSAKLLQETAKEAAGNGLCPSNFNSLSEAEQISLVEADSDILHCYCDRMGIIKQGSSRVCKTYLQRKVQAQVLTYFASAIVLMINLLLGRVIAKFADFEKHHTADQRNKSIVTRLFILKYINTGAVFLIQNNRVILRDLLGIERSTAVEFSSDWFETIGVTIILVQLGDLVASQGPNLYSMFKYYYRLYRARKDEKCALTQADLQELHVGPQMDVSFKYAQLLSTVFTCLTYSTGMPILNFIACVNFLVFYFVEKFMFIRVYRTPRRYNSDLGRQASNFIPAAMLIHLGMAIWILSNTEMFYTPEENQHSTTLQDISDKFGSQIVFEKITRQHTYMLFLFFVGIFFFAASVNLSRKMYRYFSAFMAWLYGDKNFREKLKRDFEEYKDFGDAILYSRAVRRNLIKGVANYNPLENPDYKASFGISWKFALNNHNMRSVRNFNELTDADDADAVKIELARRKRYDARVAEMARLRGAAPLNKQSTQKGKGGQKGKGAEMHKKASYRRRIELLNKDNENDDLAGLEDVETGGL